MVVHYSQRGGASCPYFPGARQPNKRWRIGRFTGQTTSGTANELGH